MKVLNPLAILHIGLSAGHVLDVMSVDQPHIDLALLQDLEQWDPVHSGRFHRHGSNLALLKPVCESLQIDGKRWERPNWLFVAVSRNRDEDLRRTNYRSPRRWAL